MEKTFEENIKKLIDPMEKKIGLLTNTISESGNDSYLVYETLCRKNISRKYTWRFISKKDSFHRLEVIFFINGTMSVALYLYDDEKKDKVYENISPRKFLGLAKEIKEHLMI